MTAFRNSRGVLGALLGAGLVFGHAALAQDSSRPKSLIPGAGGRAAPAEAPRDQDDSARRDAPPPDAAEEKPGPGRIEVGTLRALDPSAVGLLHESNGGFGIDMWAGTPRALVERLIPRLPAPAASATMRDLMRRLLLTAANVPPGETTLGENGPGMLFLRAERLAAGGDAEGVGGLMQAASLRFDEPGPARLEVDALWLGGDFAGACGIARDMLAQDRDPAWLKAVTFCRMLDEQTESAALATDLLREEGMEDPAFFSLVRILAGDKQAKIDSLPNATPLHLAMLSAAQRSVPADAVSSGDPGVLRALAMTKDVDIDIRLAAAERAEAQGAVSARLLGEIYGAVPVDPDARANAISLARSKPGPRSRALLYQVTQTETVPAARVEALRTALRLARADGSYFTSARVNYPIIREIRPAPELAWAAAELGRALLVAGDAGRAGSWFDVVRQSASKKNIEAVAAVISLWPLMQLADAGRRLPWDGVVVRHWWNATVDMPADQRGRRAAFLFVLLDALGYPVPTELWAELQAGANPTAVTVPPPQLRHGLKSAAAGGRVGGTVLFALLVLGDAGPGGIEPSALAEVVAGLRAVGLEQEARGLAIEAALAQGF